MKTPGLLLAATVALAAPPRVAAAAPSAALDWRLPPYATREGDLLTIDVPESAARQGCRVEANVDLSAFDGMAFEAEIEASGERIAKPRAAWNGLKFQFEYTDPASGETFYPNTASRLGDFPRQTLHVRDSLCTQKRDARIVLGLQDTSGRVVFDLSTLRIRACAPYWPVTNQTHRCAYRAPVGMITIPNCPQIPNVHKFSLSTNVNDNSDLIFVNNGGQLSFVDNHPLRGCMSPGRDMTEDDFRTLRDWGATLLRYQMVRDWGKIGANRDLAEYEAWLEGRLAHFESFVLPMCRKYGMKVVLDLHVTPGGRNAQGEFSMFFEREYADWFVDFWRRTAARFAPVVQTMGPVIYGYDLCNEPVQHGEALPECDWWSLQRRAAEAIREVDPETPVIVETNNWDVPSAFGMLSPLALVNVIYEVHVYNPIQFTHQGIMGHPMGVTYPNNAARGWDREYLRRVLGPVRAFQEKHGAKIYVGEFSAAAWAPGADQYLRDCIALFNEYGWDWTYHAFRESPVWDVEKKFGADGKIVPSPDIPRKRALLDGFSVKSIQ